MNKQTRPGWRIVSPEQQEQELIQHIKDNFKHSDKWTSEEMINQELQGATRLKHPNSESVRLLMMTLKDVKTMEKHRRKFYYVEW